MRTAPFYNIRWQVTAYRYTGVGKTEVARQLAKELGIELVRFDMSEYTEKHTVAKLIGRFVLQVL